MRLGISSYSYGWAVGVPGNRPDRPLSVLGLLEKAREFGVSVLQIGDNLPLHEQSDPELDEILRVSMEYGVQIETGTRGFKREILLRYAELASFFHSPILRVVTDMREYEPDADEIVAVAIEVMPEFKKRGVILAIENHDRFRSRELARIIERIGSDWAGICLDTVNSIGAAEGAETVVDHLASYTVNLHVKDFSIRRLPHLMGFTVEGRPAGQGMLNIPWLQERLAHSCRDMSAILELWTPPELDFSLTLSKEERWVEESIAYLKRIRL
jgi:sugar phosphate isomerase/epimerase